MRFSYDAVIVGSGAGGGTAAAALSGKGLKVAVLEAGPRLRRHELTGRELEMASRLYEAGGAVLTRDKALSVAMGRGYGGSTAVYTGTSLPPSGEALRRWKVPGLEPDDLLRRAREQMEAAGARLLPPESLNESNRLFAEACRRLGWRCFQFPVNVGDCAGLGLCNLGCPRGAKRGTGAVQLPAAERAGVEVVTKCRVLRLREGLAEVEVWEGGAGEPGAWPAGRHEVQAGMIIAAAGAVRTPALLLRSGLGGRLPRLGEGLTLHPALVVVGRHPRPIVGLTGHPKSYCCDEFGGEGGFLLESCMYFPFTTAKSLAGFGAEHSRMMSAMDRLQMVLVLALDEPAPGNRVELSASGEAVLRYRLSPATEAALRRGMGAAARILFEAGCESVHLPGTESFLIERREMGRVEEIAAAARPLAGRAALASAHPMGGCGMGGGPADSVADAWGRAHGLPWLRVADASLFPASPGVNPYVTVMALADRTAEGARRDLGELMGARDARRRR